MKPQQAVMQTLTTSFKYVFTCEYCVYVMGVLNIVWLRMMQRTIREHFINVTILTIAHRLPTIIDYDKVGTL